MDYVHRVRFGVFINPVAPAEHSLGAALLALEEADALHWFASEVIPAVRESVAKAR